MEKILVIDRNNSESSGIFKLLSSLGYSIFMSESREDALNKLDSRDFNLILVDESIISENPSESIEEIRALDENIPIVITFDLSQKKLIRSIDKDKNNIADFVQKPYDANNMVFLIESLLSNTEQKPVKPEKPKKISLKKDREESRRKMREMLIKERLAKLVNGE